MSMLRRRNSRESRRRFEMAFRVSFRGRYWQFDDVGFDWSWEEFGWIVVDFCRKTNLPSRVWLRCLKIRGITKPKCRGMMRRSVERFSESSRNSSQVSSQTSMRFASGQLLELLLLYSTQASILHSSFYPPLKSPSPFKPPNPANSTSISLCRLSHFHHKPTSISCSPST
jgi:hypothetical protein